MVAPSGQQHEIASGPYRAVVTESGAALRTLTYEGRALVDGFAEDAMANGGRGQVLAPWPNRIRDGRYTFADQDLQLPLTEPARHNASHGLVRWVAWTVEQHAESTVELSYRLMAQTGYPWTLDLTVRYALDADGLVVTHTAANRAATHAPYAAGMHPYLVVGEDGIDDLVLTLPASARLLTDDRLLPIGEERVEGTPYDFREPRRIETTRLDAAFTDLARDEDGRATTVLEDPASGRGVALWVDERHDWLQVFSADDTGAGSRRALAVEPMTAPADAFNSGRGLVTLTPGERFAARWGIRST